MENKKTKLTISGIAKKSIKNIEIAKTQGKKSVLIDKSKKNFVKKGSSFRPSGTGGKFKSTSTFNRGAPFKPSFGGKTPPISNDFERRKLAEQRATRRIKSDIEGKEKKQKSGTQKREVKLTVSRALSDEIEARQRSLASVKRAREKEQKNLNKSENKENLKPIKRDINIPEVITVRELANRMAEQSSNVIKHLFGMGVTVTINQSLAADTAEYLVKEFGHNPIREEKAEEIIKKIKLTRVENLKNRPPIVTVMGHVDHGKTSVLDVLRSANVVSGEFGGITQHIGAYQIENKSHKLTFIDTPGHAAFTEMRARGSRLTDIVVLVVAADDGVKPQTVESIKHAKAAKVPIVVAINKCDLPEADPQKIKNQLLEHELIAEDLSGDTLMVEISAKTKKNLDKLIESIVLQAEILDLKTDFDTKATGVVLESKIDVGRGPVATIIVTTGTLKKGDFFVSGLKWGKVRAIINDKGKNIDKASPSTPVEILGINGAAKAGDDFIVLESEKEAKTLSENRAQESKDGKNPLSFATQESAFSDKSIEELNLIIKSDVHGSSEAIKNAVSQIKHEEVKPKIILADIGMVTETDVTLAKASNAVLIAFNVKPSKEAKKLAENENIKISSYNIIYEVLDYIKKKMSGLLSPDVEETITGNAQVLEIFKVSGAGKVAGCKIIEGEITSNSEVRLIRDGTIIHTGKIGTIFREKNQVKLVSNGQECGITIKEYMDFQKNDTIEAFNVISKERTV
ncbi:MAG: translation initiation factor IF-2 [Pelagibacteraceae bacterium TMED201]|nr:MAG: translation initiation factor IF-2 [Pelagibacteraceae bacterium TMED201]|tara:strand:- start:196 stop:2421 length:2226 start_codon:yes stop_codon:yes gene_type:complete